MRRGAQVQYTCHKQARWRVNLVLFFLLDQLRVKSDMGGETNMHEGEASVLGSRYSSEGGLRR